MLWNKVDLNITLTVASFSSGVPQTSWTLWWMVYLYLFPHMRRQSTAVGASASHRSVDPLSSYWSRTHQNTVRWLRSFGPIRIVAPTQPIRAQIIRRHLMKRSNQDPETLGTTVTNGLCKVHFLMIKTTKYWTIPELTFSFLIVHFLAQESLWLFFQPLIVDSSFCGLKYQWKTGADVLKWPYCSDIILCVLVTCCNIDLCRCFHWQAEDVAITFPPWGETRCSRELLWLMNDFYLIL